VFEREYFVLMVVWFAATLAKGVAAYVLWRNGLKSRLPTLWVLLMALCTQGIALMVVHRDPMRYALVYAWSSWMILLLEGLSVVWVFRAVTEKYPRFGHPGSVLLTGLAIIGACACWMVGFLAPPAGWSKAWEIAMFVQRDVGLVMIAMLAGSRLLLPQVSGIPIRKSARRASDILTLYVLTACAGSAFTVATAGRHAFASTLIPLVNGGALAVFCAVFLTRASDVCEEARTPAWADDANARKSVRLQVDGVEEIGRILGHQ
jgi:hypothetical protein